MNQESSKSRLERLVIELFSSDNWSEKMQDFFNSNAIDNGSKTELIWLVNDLLKKKTLTNHQALEVAKFYMNNTDPIPGSKMDEKLANNEENLWIEGVRACVPHLLSTILGSLDTEYYDDILDILNKMVLEETEKSPYVRMQAFMGLGMFFANFYAVKDINDSNSHFLTNEQKFIIMDILFKTLEENKSLPRFLELIGANVNRLVRLNKNEAMSILKSLIFTKDGNFQPDYVLHVVAPTLIYYAEIRSGQGDGFNDTDFKKLLEDLLQADLPAFKYTITWHIWKFIKDHNDSLSKFEPYFKYLFNGKFSMSLLSQLEFLIQQVLPLNHELGVKLTKQTLEYVKNRDISDPKNKDVWLLVYDDIYKNIATLAPDNYNDCLDQLYGVWLSGNVYVGDLQTILTAFKVAPLESQSSMKTHAQSIFEKMKENNKGIILNEIQWE